MQVATRMLATTRILMRMLRAADASARALRLGWTTRMRPSDSRRDACIRVAALWPSHWLPGRLVRLST